VDEVLELVGLTSVARKRAGKFSLGMGQRLGIAAALLGDPPVLLFDEPVNGLDPEGIRWVRTLCKHLAAEGRTVFISSHLMAEMALTADDLVVIGRGKLIVQTSMSDFLARSSRQSVRLRTPSMEKLADALRKEGGIVLAEPDGSASVTGMSAPDIGDLALSLGIAIHELAPVASLEDAFMELTDDTVEFRGAS
jgi:ABC-2 type transport system ATP-binding protein